MGTRGSGLALAQSGGIAAQLRQHYPEWDIETVVIQTSGDTFKGEILAEAGGKGLFAKEIEEALLQGRIDFAVHSLKDLPGFLAEGLMLACYPTREDPRDCLISQSQVSLKELPAGSKIGTSSPRRAAQILSLRPDCETAPIRGNVDTRLKKLERGDYDAIVLAAAGLNRLGFGMPKGASSIYLDSAVFIPAVGQGVLGIETRNDEPELTALLNKALGDPDTAIAARAERSFLAAVGGDCTSPIAAHAAVAAGEIRMSCWMGSPDGKRFVRLDRRAGLLQPEFFGESIAKEALAQGGREILDAIVRHPKI